MSRLFIVAGNSTGSLSDYLKDKGSFEIVGSAESLVRDQRSLAAKTVISDKLILYLQDTDLKFKQELMSLRKLVFGDSFFLFSECYVFLRESDPDRANVEELLTIFIRDVDNRSDLNAINVSITDTKEEYTFGDIYNTIIGESHIENMENQRIAKIRKPRADDSRYAYAPADDLDTVIKPYDYTNIFRQEDVEKNAFLAGTGERLVERKREMQKSNKEIPLVDVEQSQRKEVLLLVGEDNSGKSLLGISIAIAASMEQKRICFVDMKPNSDMELILEKGMGTRIPFSEAMLKDIYCYKVKHPDHYSFTIVKDIYRKGSVLPLVNFLGDLPEMPYDVAVVEVSMDFYLRYQNLLSSFVSLTIMMCPMRTADVRELAKILKEETGNILVALTEFMPETNFNRAMTVKEIKDVLGLEQKLMAPLDLRTLHVPKSLYTIVRSVMK